MNAIARRKMNGEVKRILLAHIGLGTDKDSITVNNYWSYVDIYELYKKVDPQPDLKEEDKKIQFMEMVREYKHYLKGVSNEKK